MVYTLMFLARYLPFWALPLAFITYQLGIFYYRQRIRIKMLMSYAVMGFCIIATLIWAIFGGYWRAGLLIKKMFE